MELQNNDCLLRGVITVISKSSLGQRKRVRGCANARETWLREKGNHHTILVSDAHAFVGDFADELHTFISSHANSCVRMPHELKKGNEWITLTWRSKELDPLKQRYVDDVFCRFTFLWEENLSVFPRHHIETLLLRALHKSWGQFKTRSYNDKVKDKSAEERIQLRPKGYDPDYWLALILHFESQEFQETSRQGSANKSKQPYTHLGGSQSTSQWKHKRAKAIGKRPGRMDSHDRLYLRNGVPIYEKAGEDNGFLC